MHARPKLIRAAQDLTECFRVRYCLYRGCLLQVPAKQTLPKGLQGRYLWPNETGKFETAIQWIKVMGVGSLSPTEFKRRFCSEDGCGTYPLVLRLNVHSRTEDGRFCSLDVTPWEFMLLERCTRARQTVKGVIGVDEKELHVRPRDFPYLYPNSMAEARRMGEISRYEDSFQLSGGDTL